MGMGKYSAGSYRQVKERRWEVHPVWRGIGCVMIIIIPLISFLLARMLYTMNFQYRWTNIPKELAKGINFTAEARNMLATLSQYSPSISNQLFQLSSKLPETGTVYYTELGLMLLFIILFFGLISVLYAGMYSAIGPSRYGPVDSPPIRKSPRQGVKKSR